MIRESQNLIAVASIATSLKQLDAHAFNSSKDGIPAVIVLDQLNCLASLADIFDFSQLEKDSSW